MGDFAKIAAYMAEYHYEILKNLEISNQISALNVVALYEKAMESKTDLSDKFKEASGKVQLKTQHMQQVFEIVFNRMLVEEPLNPAAFVNIMRYYMKHMMSLFEESTANQYKIMAMLETMVPISRSKEMIEGAKKMKDNEYHVLKKRTIPAVDVDIKESKVMIKVDIPETDDPIQQKIHGYMKRVYSGEDDISDDEEYDEKLEEKQEPEFDILACNHSAMECHIEMVVELKPMPEITDEIKQRCNELFDIQYKKLREEQIAKQIEERKQREVEMEKKRQEMIERFRQRAAEMDKAKEEAKKGGVKIIKLDTSAMDTSAGDTSAGDTSAGNSTTLIGNTETMTMEEIDELEVVDTPEIEDDIEGYDHNEWQFSDFKRFDVDEL